MTSSDGSGPYAKLVTRLYEVNGLFSISDSPQHDGTCVVTIVVEDDLEDGASVELQRGGFHDVSEAEEWGWWAYDRATNVLHGISVDEDAEEEG